LTDPLPATMTPSTPMRSPVRPGRYPQADLIRG
jgi:hypothetical protein